MTAVSEPVPRLGSAFRFEDAGRVYTDEMLAAEPGLSWEWKEREARRLHGLWDGFAPGRVIVEDDSPRGFHWEPEKP